MLSKVLRGEDANNATALPWKSAVGSRSRALSTAVTPVPAKPAASANRIVTTHDQLEVLQARVAELEQVMDKRVQEASQKAYRDGESAARAQTQPLLEKLARSIQELAALRSQLRHQAESDLLKLSLAIARKIVHREISADPEALTALVRVALEKIRLQEILRVRTHPQHQPAIQQILARLSGGVQIEIQADPRLQLGSVIADTTRGEFDASVEVQLREIERGLTDRLTALG